MRIRRGEKKGEEVEALEKSIYPRPPQSSNRVMKTRDDAHILMTMHLML